MPYKFKLIFILVATYGCGALAHAPLPMNEENNNKENLNLCLDVSHIGDSINLFSSELQTGDFSFAASASYTFRNGFGVGLTGTNMINSSSIRPENHNITYGHTNIYFSYLTDYKLKFMTGVGYLLTENVKQAEKVNGVMLGIGYGFDEHFNIEMHFSDVRFSVDSLTLSGPTTNILFGIKW